MITRPDILVLGGGGVLGRAWMTGVLAGIEDGTGFDLRRCEYFIGTSAGSIVGAQLVAGRSPKRPSRTGTELEPTGAASDNGNGTGAIALARRAGAWAVATTPFAPMALSLAAPGGRLVRAALLRTMPRPYDDHTALRHELDAAGARFDGRLRVVAVEKRSGRRVVFGRPGSPNATVSEAVVASCAIPWMFKPVLIGDREYVDGGVWSATNLDVAPAGRGTHVLCLNPLASLAGGNSLLGLARSAVRSAVSVEALAVRRRGADVSTVSPDPESAAAMGPNPMDPGPRHLVHAAGYRQGLALVSAP